jgi:hypothetical protein
MAWLILAIATAGPGQDQDPEAIRRQLHDILGRSEFRQKMPSEFWSRLREMLRIKSAKEEPEETKEPQEGPCQISGPGVGGSTMKIVFILGLAILVAFLIAILYQVWAKRAPPSAPALSAAGVSGVVPPGGLDPLSRDSQEWAREADVLFAEGRIAEAIRALYLAALACSHSRRWIDFHPSKPNWEHVRRFSGPGPARGNLGSLTSVFEQKWYGRKTAVESEYRASRDAAAGILGTPGAPP